MEKLTFGDNFSHWTKFIMFNIIYVVGALSSIINYISLKTKVYALVGVTRLLDRVDVTLQKTGIKLMRLTRERIMDSLSEDEKREILSEDVKVAFEMYTRGLERDTSLSLYRRIYMIRVIKHLLNVRVKTRQLLNARPHILQIPIRRPIFIVSLPRSGTTLLSRLMSRDPSLRAPVLREMMHPYRMWAEEPDNSVYRQTQLAFEMDQHLRGKEYRKIHTIGLDQPEECLTLTMLSFWQHTDFVRLPCLSDCESWFYRADHTYHKHMYETYRRQIQILTRGDESRRLLLKCSIHLMSLQALLETFPDACLVYTVRPVSEVVPSYCSNIQHLHNYAGSVDKKFGKRMLRLMSELTARSVTSFRKFDQLPANQSPLYMCDYKDLVRDPLKTTKKIYQKFGMELSSQAEGNMMQYIRKNPQNKYGRHQYSLEQYGLTYDEVKEECKVYEDYMKTKGFTDVI